MKISSRNHLVFMDFRKKKFKNLEKDGILVVKNVAVKLPRKYLEESVNQDML